MKMRKSYWYVLLLTLSGTALLFSCNRKDPAHQSKLEGRIKGIAKEQLYLSRMTSAGLVDADSTSTDRDGSFSMDISIKEAGFYSLHAKDGRSVLLVMEPGITQKLYSEGRDFDRIYSVEGSDESKHLWRFSQITSLNKAKVDSLGQAMKDAQSSNEFASIKLRLDSAYQHIYAVQREQVIALIRDHPGYLANVLIVNQLFGSTAVVSPEMDDPLFQSIDSSVSLKYSSNENFRDFHTQFIKSRTPGGNSSKGGKGLAIGERAPDFLLPDKSGKMLKLASFQGKMKLIFFWASWNADSRNANHELQGIYDQFHSRGLEIIGISIDTDRTSWMDACRMDRLPWPQLIDTSGFESEVTRNFRVTGLPGIVLTDNKAMVIAGSLSLSELRALLMNSPQLK